MAECHHQAVRPCHCLVSLALFLRGGNNSSLCICLSFQVLFCFGGTRVWTQDLALAWQVLLLLQPVPSPFGVGYFWNRVLIHAQVSLDRNSLIYASPHSWHDRLCQHTQPLVEIESGKLLARAGLTLRSSWLPCPNLTERWPPQHRAVSKD
jgi:hypothetical protein